MMHSLFRCKECKRFLNKTDPDADVDQFSLYKWDICGICYDIQQKRLAEPDTSVIYVVGQAKSFDTATSMVIGWELQGVFDCESDAVRACHDFKYFVLPVPRNTSFPKERVEVTEAYWPYEEET